MQRPVSVMLMSLLVAGGAEAASFRPKLTDVCSPAPVSPAMRSKVDPKRFVDLLFKTHGIHDFDLGRRPGDGADVKITAVVNGDAFCDGEPSRCTPGTAEKLGAALAALDAFLRRNSQSVPAGDGGFEVMPPVGRDFDQARLTAFLRGATGAHRVACVAGPAAAPRPQPSQFEAKATKLLSAIAVRKNIEDLTVPRRDSGAFEALDRATIAYTDDRIKGTRTLATTGAVGYQLPYSLLGDYASTILFADYSGNRVWADDPKNSENIGNIGAGVLGSFDFRTFGFFQNVKLFSHFVHSHVTNSDLLSVKATITPNLGIPGVNLAFNPNDGPLAFLLKPELKLVYGSVLYAGANPLLIDTDDYARGGGKVAFWIFGVDGIFKNFTFNASYESLKVWRGPLDTISRFESALSYTLGDQENWAIELKYVNGRNVDTLEREQIVKLGLGYKQ